ncbi:hypothetical protein B0T25DRAFT_578420 [Lasiosphaeria hispida]|uniref:T6SS Phospholipase effector Tle1-like catalytic domain-containing protein n=1 Tax=Lasiosphaeria hispida TaxID=260671 RepID=A0AAJ0MIS3_9PEZI|nr:hypothetical protein B0T25DRAFT_578420 [Lasiosphaeria hispida]
MSSTGFSQSTSFGNGHTSSSSDTPQEHKKLVLCFDGTGNTFSGSNADTNVVKLLTKLDRNDPHQFHYYQTGIGTYDVDATTVDQTLLGSIRSSIEQTMDQGFGSGFDAHVLAGYRFLMRYYDSGDKIYMFGFSRGAFTAKFLARMINTVGLLCKGNEEMVPFAYRLYQRYLAGDIQEFSKGRGPKKGNKKMQNNGTNSDAAEGHQLTEPLAVQQSGDTKDHPHRDEIAAFSNTFCRKEQTVHNGQIKEQNIKVYFLGIWDCVSSVAVLERKAPKPVQVNGTAQYVRHAVAVDERRVKFKAALLAQDIRASALEHDSEDIKEVWFPGCHGDVGGGWPASESNPLDTQGKMTTWQRIKNLFTTRKANHASKSLDSGPFQMSDIPLAWMIREIELVGQRDPASAVKWRDEQLDKFKRRLSKRKTQALEGFIHDSLQFGFGTGFVKVFFWKFMEWLPIITRWELEKDEWVNVRFPLNKGAARDIPPDAVLHESLLHRLRNNPSYHPTNNHGGDTSPCLKHKDKLVEVKLVNDQSEPDPDHQTYTILRNNEAE